MGLHAFDGRSLVVATAVDRRSWLERRSRLNHDWLKNRYLQALGMWLNVLDGKVEDDEFAQRIATTILPEWSAKRLELERLVHDYEIAMSPERLLGDDSDALPIRGAPRWLGPALHQLWLVRDRVPESSAKLLHILDETNRAQIIAAAQVDKTSSTSTVKNVPKAVEAVRELKNHCEALGRGLSALRSDLRPV